jgi:hypothetical protein
MYVFIFRVTKKKLKKFTFFIYHTLFSLLTTNNLFIVVGEIGKSHSCNFSIGFDFRNKPFLFGSIKISAEIDIALVHNDI